jgi:3-methyladenine DNA glycosylase AlkC
MEPFKNNLSPELVRCIAGHLEKHLRAFDRGAYEASILAVLPELELKQRAQLIADHTHAVLPSDVCARNEILEAMLYPGEGVGIDVPSNEQGIRGWGLMPLGMVVGQHGLVEFDGSMALLREMTKRATAEFDVRHFLIADQDRALAIMNDWIGDPSVHVRRLVSEGTRPRLPWGMQLKRLIEDPSPVLPFLETLRDDPEEYVRRSVANHLNDIAKDHPDLVADLAKDWMAGADGNRQRLVRHACRTLIKQGHPGALKALGLNAPEVRLEALAADTPSVVFGQALEFSARITSRSAKPQPLVIDYLVHFRKANGALAGKVFKWKKVQLQPGETLLLQRKHSIRSITTRKYYAGEQELSLRINGQDFGKAGFELLMPDV